jgi:hypothetical protein
MVESVKLGLESAYLNSAVEIAGALTDRLQ